MSEETEDHGLGDLRQRVAFIFVMDPTDVDRLVSGIEVARDAEGAITGLRIAWRDGPPKRVYRYRKGDPTFITISELRYPEPPPAAPTRLPADFKPSDFLALMNKAREIEKVAKALSVKPEELEQYPFRLAERKQGGFTSFYVYWDRDAPPFVNVSDSGVSIFHEAEPRNLWEELGFIRNLSEDQQRHIVDRINGLAPDDKCPVCGGVHGLAPFLTRVGYGMDEEGGIGAIWVAMTACSRCGYIRHFLANELGLGELPDAG